MKVPIVKPYLPKKGTRLYKQMMSRLEEIFETGMLTNSKYVKMFEEECAKKLQAKYCVAVTNCTTGMELVMRALNLRGKIHIPSFTFTASAVAAKNEGLEIAFYDYKGVPVTDQDSCAIMAVNEFGNPAKIDWYAKYCRGKLLPLIFDSAHVFGATINGVPICKYGTAHVFSLTPTKVLTAMEGGIVATNDKELADRIKLLRNYGLQPDYQCKQVGKNARMTEAQAIVGLATLKLLDKSIRKRKKIAKRYDDAFYKLGIAVPFSQHPECIYKDYAITFVNREVRDGVYDYCLKNDVGVKKYFDPPVHKQFAFYRSKPLPLTNDISSKVLCLPIYPDLTREQQDYVVKTIKRGVKK